MIRIIPKVHRWRGDASLNKHEFDKALSEYDEAIRLDPKNGMAYCGRGAASTGKGEFEKAIASFDEAIRLDPEIANMSFYKRYRAAAESLRPNPRNPKFAEEAQRGSDAFERADYDQAIVAFDELIRLDPNHSEAHRWRGDASLNKHELDKALSEYDEAIRLDPKNGMAYCGRGAASTGKGEFDKAIASFDEAIRLDPRLPRCRSTNASGQWPSRSAQTRGIRSLPKRPSAAQMRSREGITIKPSSPGTKRSALIRIIPRSTMAWRCLVE